MTAIPKLSASAVSLAAAHGLTASLWQSWYPALVRTPRVMVPIELEVLMVRDATLAWADCGMRTPPKANEANGAPPTPAADLTPPPFAELAAPRPRGAYLHWYLPKGLTSGNADDTSNSAQFPPVPDRWLVLRISGGATPLRRAVTGWVLEAGSEPAVARPLATWTEPGPQTNVQNALTAVGHGDLAWAGYFDNVRNRLGFYDSTLERDKVRGPIAYLVCGWYGAPSADPLGAASVNSLAAFNAAMQQLGWQLDTGQLAEVVATRFHYLDVIRMVGLEQADPPQSAYTTHGEWWPHASLFHGAVVGIDWPGSNDKQEAGGPPDPASIVVAAGDTMTETLAALIARANGKPDEAAIVEALQLGVLAELDQPDGRAKLDVQLHASSFASQPGGAASTEPFTVAPSGPPPAPPANPHAPGPGVFAAQRTGAFTTAAGGLREVAEARFDTLPGRDIAQLEVPVSHAPLQLAERIVNGRLGTIISQLGAGATIPPGDPGGTFDALRAMPRFYTPKDPVVLIQGGKRAFTHDSSVKTENGMVVCRLTPVSELSWTMPQQTMRYAVRGDDVLEHGVGNGSVPPECEGLLRETVLLDHGSAPALAASVAQRVSSAGFDVATATLHAQVEQTVWQALRNPRIDGAPLIARSGIAGMLPAAFAVSPAARPWTPLHLDWTVEYLPSPNGENDWTLGELDFALNPGATIPKAGSGTLFTGRATLTGGAAATLGAAVRKAVDDVTRIGATGPVPSRGIEAHFSQLAQQLSANLRTLTLASPATAAAAASTASGAASGASSSAGSPAAAASASDGAPLDPALLDDIGNALAQMDVLSCGLNGLLTQLRGGIPADGKTGAPTTGTPTPFFAVRAGVLRLVRLRLVDGFGQFVDLCGSDASHAATGYVVSDPASVPEQPGLISQPPRFSAPTRAWFRYMSADQPGVEADYQTSPVCAFVMPNHLDGSLEFFNADGGGAGTLQPDDAGQVGWQGAPGVASAAGRDPTTSLANGYAAQFARSLIDWGVADAGESRESALAALLRTIDSTLWSVDPFGHQGDEHLALLVGHPVCVMRALLRLDVADPVVTADGRLANIPVRLGNLTQWNDGLLGYFVNDDYTLLHVADAAAPGMAREVGPGRGFLQQINAVPQYYTTFADDIAANATSANATPGATPVSHPYVDTSGVLWIRPNQTINLTLLVEPFNTVHASAGRVPRKEIGMRRAWVNDGLAAIAPTFRFGPVLVDPKQIRMPLATDLNGTWVWDYRASAVQWSESPVTNATDDALLGSDPPSGSEGWLKLEQPKKTPGSQS